jgi:hypothetical protein
MGSGRYWSKHPKKELEALLGEFHDAGWRIEDPPVYYHVLCPCGNHQRWIHLTPSGSRYVRNALAWLYRQPCYEGSKEEK